MLVHFAADAVIPGGKLHERRGINGYAERADVLMHYSEPGALSECQACGTLHATGPRSLVLVRRRVSRHTSRSRCR